MASWGYMTGLPLGVGPQTGYILEWARTHLNDDEAIIWPDHKLLPKFRQAFAIMEFELVKNGVPVTSVTAPIMLVPAGTTDLRNATGYPIDIEIPLWMKERASGQTMQDFVDMTEVDFLPQLNPSSELIWWNWSQQYIQFLGSTQDREVLLRYRKRFGYINEVTDPTGFQGGEIYLGFKTAALAVNSITPRDESKLAYLNSEAEKNLESVLILASLQQQNLPAKRRPYHRGRGRSRVLRDF